MKKKPTQIQQGDVVLTRVTAKERGTPIAPRNGKLILADGEATGHCHTIGETEDAELIRVGERMILRLSKAATVTHQEHKPVKIPVGIWEIGRIQEYDYLKQMSRPVID